MKKKSLFRPKEYKYDVRNVLPTSWKHHTREELQEFYEGEDEAINEQVAIKDNVNSMADCQEYRVKFSLFSCSFLRELF